jgi:hypothetical protein
MRSLGKAKEASIAVTVIRNNGQVERLGVVSYWHRNPLRRLWWALKRRLRDNFTK